MPKSTLGHASRGTSSVGAREKGHEESEGQRQEEDIDDDDHFVDTTTTSIQERRRQRQKKTNHKKIIYCFGTIATTTERGTGRLLHLFG
jgi:hypothetical protein